MISVYRTANIARSQIDAPKFAMDVATYMKQSTGTDIRVEVPIGGNPFRIRWSSQHTNLAAYEAWWSGLLRDPKYIEVTANYSEYFAPGTAQDEIWQSL